MARIDKIDIQIMTLLQDNAKLTIKEISAKVGISSTPTYDRVKRLEKLGYIQRYVAIISPEKVGQSLTVFLTITLRSHEKEEVTRVEKQLSQIPESLECYHVTGEYDYFLKVVMEDMGQYRNFIIDRLANISNLFQVKSHIVVNCVKSTTALPLALSNIAKS